jgi:hypothetical protein
MYGTREDGSSSVYGSSSSCSTVKADMLQVADMRVSIFTPPLELDCLCDAGLSVPVVLLLPLAHDTVALLLLLLLLHCCCCCCCCCSPQIRIEMKKYFLQYLDT